MSHERMRLGLIALVVKVGPKLISVFLKLLKVLKSGKLALAGASFASYSLLFSWQFALLLMGMLFVHESGHVWAMRRCGVKTKGFYFIPLLGGAAVADEEFPSRASEVYIAIMGPIWGLLLSLATVAAYAWTGMPVLAGAAAWMAAVNLFNMLPVNPLDGGRVLKSIAFSINYTSGMGYLWAGGILCIAATLTMGMGLFALLLVVGLLEVSFEARRTYVPQLTAKEMVISIGVSILTCWFLWMVIVMLKDAPGAAAALEALK